MKRLISCLLTAVFMLCAFPPAASAASCVIYRNGKVVADTVFLDGTTYFNIGLNRNDSDFASPTLFYHEDKLVVFQNDEQYVLMRREGDEILPEYKIVYFKDIGRLRYEQTGRLALAAAGG